MLESSLDQICKNIQEAEDYRISLNDIKGSGIQRAALYLRKVANVVLPFQSNTWKTLTDLNKVRNIFVHSDSNIDKSNSEVINFSQKYSGLSAYESFDNQSLSLSLSKEFGILAVETIENFFHDIHKNIQPSNKK